MEEQTATEPTEENTCSTVNDLIDNELRFRDMCLPKVSAEHEKRFFFFKWCYRRILRISWSEHVTNEEVLNMANTKPTLLDGILKRRLDFHGHLVRKGCITFNPMIVRIHGTRPR